jgi:hypothetical protein
MSKYSIPETVAVSDSGFLFLPSSGETFTLNHTGREIFQLIQKGVSEEDIFKNVLDEYDIDRRTLEKDFGDFTLQLQKYSLLKEE